MVDVIEYKVRIAVHGLIPVTEEERSIVDTQVFQRLRRIRQLGMTDLVYPSANHTRFEHSLGTMHVAGLIASSLNLSDAALRTIRLAALLHDIGHGPFSHVSEDVIDRLAGLDKAHEYYGAATVLHHPEISGILNQNDRKAVSQIIVPLHSADREYPLPIEYQKRRTLEKDIVSGPADADKMDYLLRDTHHCGVKYGEFDLDKVVSSTLRLRHAGQEQLGFSEDAVWALEQMLLARHHMHRQVYGHETRAVTDAMLSRSMEDGIVQGHIPRPDFDWNSGPANPGTFLENYLQWNDQKLLQALVESPGTVGELARRLQERHLLKAAFRMELEEMVNRYGLAPSTSALLLDKHIFTREVISSVEGAIAEAIELNPRLVILALDSVKNPTYRPPASRMEVEFLQRDIMLQNENGQNVPFTRASEIFGSVMEVERNYLTVYCPMDVSGREREGIVVTVEKILFQELQDFYTNLS